MQRIIEHRAIRALNTVASVNHIARPFMVCDDATWAAAGHHVAAQLSCEVLNFGKSPKASLENARRVQQQASEYDGLIAVGAGTINDLTKYAAHQLGKPYICVATAASMNGYSSANASLITDGHKRSYAATPPIAVVVDMEVIVASPKRLTRAGLADTLARTTVEADCLLSHYVLGTPYPREAFDALRAHEATLLKEAAKLGSHDPSYLTTLMNALLDAGDWMTRTGSSAIASQGEHMIAHTLELLYEPDVRYLYHGELVGVATIALNRLQHKLLLGFPKLSHPTVAMEKFTLMFGKALGEKLYAHHLEKQISPEQCEVLNSQIQLHWPQWRAQLAAIMVTPNQLELLFKSAGLAETPEALNLKLEQLQHAMRLAPLTRNRFGFLDL